MQIQNYDVYNSRMGLSLRDKLFWEGLIDDKSVNTVVDFGCANGTLLKQVHADMPDYKLYGIDNDIIMLALNQTEMYYCKFHKNFGELKDIDYGSCLLNMSSVIHEVYSYNDKPYVNDFWYKVFNTGFAYIAIRDFMPSETIKRLANIDDIRAVYYNSQQKLLNSFIKIWGDIYNNKNLVHFLLKYKYIENWEREVAENYFPITTERLLSIIPDNYEIVYFNHYILPYTKEIIKQDYGIDLKDNTHVKLLLRRRS